MISTRHIRHDWNTWVDGQSQTSVKTMCGVKSKPRLSGIPGVTEQPRVVDKGGKNVWGWCFHCVRITFPYFIEPPKDYETVESILGLYRNAAEEIKSEYHAYALREMLRAHKDGRTNSVQHWSKVVSSLS